MKVANKTVAEATKDARGAFNALIQADRKDHGALSDAAIAYANAVRVLRSAKAREQGDILSELLSTGAGPKGGRSAA